MRASDLLGRLTYPAEALARIRGVRVGVIDVGSNTIRMLVAVSGPRGVVAVRQERAFVGLGAEILEHGRIGPAKLAEAVEAARAQAAIARGLGVERLEVLVAAPGRQAGNPDELVDALARATRAPVVALGRDDEALLAWRGAVATTSGLPAGVAVCDVGGGSTELAVGSPAEGPAWTRSLDLGSLRLTAGYLAGDPPSRAELAAAAAEVERAFAGVAPPRPLAALAVGGSARGLAKLAGGRLGEAELERALGLAVERRAAKLAKVYGLDPARARVIPGGALILREVVRRLGVPLGLAGGGLREGAALELLAESAAA